MKRRTGRIRFALLWLGFIGLDTVAQISMKMAANRLSPPPFSWQWTRAAIESPLVWTAVACLIAAFALWLRILDASHISVAFAATSLTLVGVLVGSSLVLGEAMNPLGYVGAAAIMLGVFLLGALSQSESSSSNPE